MEEHKIPGSLAFIIFKSVEEQLGKNGLNMLLRRAGLEQYVENPPPDDETPTIEMSTFKNAIALVIELFGEKAAKPLLLRWGRLTFEYALQNRPTLFGLAGLVTTFMSEEGKVRFILKKVLRESETLYNVPHLLTEDENNFLIEIKECFYCGSLHSAQGICWPPVGFWMGMMKWITHKEYDVREVECRAQGAASCKFVIPKREIQAR